MRCDELGHAMALDLQDVVVRGATERLRWRDREIPGVRCGLIDHRGCRGARGLGVTIGGGQPGVLAGCRTVAGHQGSHACDRHRPHPPRSRCRHCCPSRLAGRTGHRPNSVGVMWQQSRMLPRHVLDLYARIGPANRTHGAATTANMGTPTSPRNSSVSEDARHPCAFTYCVARRAPYVPGGQQPVNARKPAL